MWIQWEIAANFTFANYPALVKINGEFTCNSVPRALHLMLRLKHVIIPIELKAVVKR